MDRPGSSALTFTSLSALVPTTITTVISNPTQQAPPSQTLGPGGVTVECPGADNTIYTVPGTTQVFRRQCGINYGAVDGAVDVQGATKSSMGDCLALCAKYNINIETTKRGCVGVTWVYIGPQGTQYNFCWIKSALGNITYFDNNESAVLLKA